MRRPVDALDVLLVERYLLEVGQAAIIVLRALSQQLFVDLHHFQRSFNAFGGLTNVDVATSPRFFFSGNPAAPSPLPFLSLSPTAMWCRSTGIAVLALWTGLIQCMHAAVAPGLTHDGAAFATSSALRLPRRCGSGLGRKSVRATPWRHVAAARHGAGKSVVLATLFDQCGSRRSEGGVKLFAVAQDGPQGAPELREPAATAPPRVKDTIYAQSTAVGMV